MDYKFEVSIIISIGIIIWNLFQQMKIARLNADLEKKKIIYKYQFEKEYEIYIELWGYLIDLRNKTALLKPTFESRDKNKTDEEIDFIKLKAVNNAFDFVVISFDKNRPFYSQNIYNEINTLLRTTQNEMVDFEFPDGTKEARLSTIKNIEKILDSLENICELIRKRIEFMEIIKN